MSLSYDPNLVQTVLAKVAAVQYATGLSPATFVRWRHRYRYAQPLQPRSACRRQRLALGRPGLAPQPVPHHPLHSPCNG